MYKKFGGDSKQNQKLFDSKKSIWVNNKNHLKKYNQLKLFQRHQIMLKLIHYVE